MKKTFFTGLIAGMLLFCFLSTAGATVYIEDFENPFPQWESDWLGTNSDLTNYYGVGEGRGNNPDGLWVDSNSINFLNGFGDNAISFSIDIAHYLNGVSLQVFDRDNSLIYNQTVIGTSGAYTDPGVYDSHAISLTNGISRFYFTGSSIRGNTSIDNVRLETGTGSPAPAPVPEPTTMLLFGAGLVGLVGARLRRKKK